MKPYQGNKHHKTEYHKDIPMQVFELLDILINIDKKEPKHKKA